MRLASVESLVRHHTLALNWNELAHDSGGIDPQEVITTPGRVLYANNNAYANQPPAMAVLLSWPAWVMDRFFHLPIEENHALVAYILTMLGVTLARCRGGGAALPHGAVVRTLAALAPGFGDRSSRVRVCSATPSCSTPTPPAAVLVLCAAACLIHVNTTKLPRRGLSWMLLSGACAALATALDPPAGFLGLLMILVIVTMRIRVRYRVAGTIAFLIGASADDRAARRLVVSDQRRSDPPASRGETRDERTRERRVIVFVEPAARRRRTCRCWRRRAYPRATSATRTAPELDADDVIAPPSRWSVVERCLTSISGALRRRPGCFSHFPVMIVGILGVLAVMHRHWPHTVKMLAGSSIGGAVLMSFVLRREPGDLARRHGANVRLAVVRRLHALPALLGRHVAPKKSHAIGMDRHDRRVLLQHGGLRRRHQPRAIPAAKATITTRPRRHCNAGCIRASQCETPSRGDRRSKSDSRFPRTPRLAPASTRGCRCTNPA